MRAPLRTWPGKRAALSLAILAAAGLLLFMFASNLVRNGQGWFPLLLIALYIGSKERA